MTDKPKVLEIEFISGVEAIKEKSFQLASTKGNYSIGRLKAKDIHIPAGDVSGDHGCFYFDSQKWYYKYGATPATNGTWKGVSNYEAYA